MALMLVQAELPEANLDLLMHAKDEQDAVAKWKRYFHGWPLPDKVKVFNLRTAVRGPDGVLPWGHIQRQEIVL